MSLSRLATATATPSPTSRRAMSWSRIQSSTTHGILLHPKSTTVTASRFSTTAPARSSHTYDTLPFVLTKKIRRVATKAVFTNSTMTPSAATSATSEAAAATAERASATTAGTSTPFTSRISPSKKHRDCDRGNNYYWRRDTRDKHHTRRRDDKDRGDHHYAGQQQQQQQGRSTRLRYEDFIQPGHHRQHYLYRQRLWHYIRQQQLHQHARNHGHHRGGHPGDHHGPGGFNPWWSQWNHHWMPWMLQLHLEDAARKAFVVGILFSCGAYGFYNFKIRQKEKWHSFRDEFLKIRDKILDTGEEPLPLWATQGRQAFSWSNPGASGSGITAYGISGGSDGCDGGRDPRAGPVSQGLQGSEKDPRMLTPERVERRLGENQRSFKVVPQDPALQGRRRREGYYSRPSRNVVLGYCVNQVASNNPIEDDMSQHFVRNVDGDPERFFFGVFDGHSGWCCSQKVAQELAPSIFKELNLVRNPRDSKAVGEAIERGFLKLDQRIVHDTAKRVLEHASQPLACSALLPAISGSCALMAYVDSRDNDLYVACVGDSRAVMGVREPTPDGGHVWRAVPLSFDQTGRNKWEVKRLQQEHPGEEATVVSRGRVLGGLEPTRAFGDARYKWTKEVQDKVFSLFPGYRSPRPNYKTPPYVTAKPVVRHHKLRSEDRFLIMATDGLWDKLTSDEAVQLIGQLLDGKIGHHEMVLDREAILAYRRQLKAKAQETLGTSTATTSVSITPAQQLQQEEEEEELTPANLAPKGPTSQVRKFTYRDQANASTHLIRNALGGADDDKVAATLAIPSPISRRHRDDITVTVVFFGQQDTKMALSDAQDAIRGFIPIR